ncbi:MAG TPA: glutamate racemase [Thermoanaerobaculia bacterium]|nr:glutamate racemase [Thermoanaerobaculia bacterium]
MNDRPIGVFDSGVGGLTVAKALLERMPGESLLYLGDTARLPYGTKSPATVARYTRRNVAFLVEQGVKAVVVACNTASATALDGFRPPVPTWGVIEPGARAAVEVARGRVGVIATESTIASGVYPRVLERLDPDLVVLVRACPLLVPLVEEGWEEDPIAVEVVRRYLAPLLAERIDTLVLGCTHYPLLRAALRQVAGEEISLVDSAAAISLVVARALEQAGLAAPRGAAPRHRLLVTDASPPFARLAHRILGPGIELERVDVVDREAAGSVDLSRSKR